MSKGTEYALMAAGLLVAWGLLHITTDSALFGSGQRESEWIVRVRTTPAIPFSGTYMTVRADGSSQSQTVEGTGQADYTLGPAHIVSAVFQKQSEAGTLKVELLSERAVVKTAETSAAFGVAQAASN